MRSSRTSLLHGALAATLLLAVVSCGKDRDDRKVTSVHDALVDHRLHPTPTNVLLEVRVAPRGSECTLYANDDTVAERESLQIEGHHCGGPDCRVSCTMSPGRYRLFGTLVTTTYDTYFTTFLRITSQTRLGD